MKSESGAQGWRGVSWDRGPGAGNPGDDIHALERAVMQDAREEAEQVLANARAEAESIRAQVEAQAETERDRLLKQAERDGKTTREQVIATAQMEAQTLKLKRRARFLERPFAEARQRLESVSQWPDYDQIARRLVREAVESLGADHAMVRIDPETRRVLTDDVLADLSQELGVYLRSGEPLGQGTGVIVETPDGHRRYDNTLAARLDRMQEALRAPVYDILSGEKE